MKPLVRHYDAGREYYFREGCHINELSNSPGDEAVSIARARVEPGSTTRWHRLSGIVERYVVLEGRGQVELGDLPAEPVGPGDVVLIPPGTPQRITSEGSQELVFLAICSPRFVPEAYEDLEP